MKKTTVSGGCQNLPSEGWQVGSDHNHHVQLRKEAWRLVYLLFLGQLVSFFLAVCNFTSSLLANYGVDTPLTQSLFSYSFLLLVYGTILLCQWQKLQVSWYWYLLLAIVDVQGNYLVIKAYQYASITSVSLLDCWVIPWVMLLTWFALGTRYSVWQFLGAAICIAGLALVLVSDSWERGGGGKKPLLGDALVIAGTFFYAFSNVGEEFCVKKKKTIEVLAMFGVFGVIISTCEIFIFEKKNLEAVSWSPTTVALFAGFAMSSFLFYTVVTFVLKMGGATLFNLSLLTSDMWAIVIRLFLYHQQVDWLYYLAFGVVVIGLIIYSLNDTTPATPTANVGEEIRIQYTPVAEEDPSCQNEALLSEDSAH